ncbi:S-formylglutathione hydrolase [Trichoderma lentiforme]|uniref:S-formylglutathione hydrolase n=1 Tax=Trichoderma lentiforme TaxID=1567552 RepID=A0A9P4X7P5_9HYPO|nr:S-formylglutathione hydrolase [Trichoderma lentiforme]
MGDFTTNATINCRTGAFQTRSTQNFTLFIPPGASVEKPAPLLIYLSDLTCSPDDVTEKGFLHAHAAPLGLALLYLDTSPRGLNLSGEHDAGDFGSGASFYINSTQQPWLMHYRMEAYITRELPALLAEYFKELDMSRVSIAGHSMGGHGGYKSVSAWAPIANPSLCPLAQKAFEGYLGEDREVWKKHDAMELVKSWKGGSLNCLIDVGTDDNFYKQGQLLPENFETAVKEADLEGLELRYQDGYDHSYFFISTFGADHVKHAAKALGLF